MKNKKVSRSKKTTNIMLIAFQFIIISSIILLSKDVFQVTEATIITTEIGNKQSPIILKQEEEKAPEKVIVYDNMTMEELTNKLNKSMYGLLEGKGRVYANYSIQYGVDPYVALAITLHETGCKWECSYLANACNNIGGMRGYTACGNTGYAKFNSLEEGIESFFINLSYNYYQQGLTDVYSIHKKYAQDPNWPIRINDYINEIRAK
ncbi:MAG: glucosaminidase domain-containing protein [Bacilli bacterium]|nr:glucosaminidase domain-containing protein [Bacilli bacterium]